MKTVHAYLKPLLKIIKDSGNSITTEEAYDKVSINLNLTSEELEITTKDGKEPLYKNLTRWARRNLKDSGFLADAKRGVWKLSEKGISYDLENFDIKDIIPKVKTISKSNIIEPKLLETNEHNESLETSGPNRDIIEHDFYDSEEEDDVAILKFIQSINPYDFEVLSKNILREYGFTELNVTKKSGDNGIDGFGKLRLNPFVSISVAFQSKRFKGNVSSPTVRDFRGAFHGRAERGVILTTGDFTKDAIKEAERTDSLRIELINGFQLIELMKTKGIGIKKIEHFRIDKNYFKSIL